MGSKKLFLCSLEPNFCQNSTFAPVFAPVLALLPFQRDDCFEVRRAREQVEREYFLDAVAVAFPFLEGIRDFVGAAEDVADAYGLAHGKCVDDARLAALARRVQQNAFRFAGDGAREPHLYKLFVDFAGDESVVLLEVLGARLCAFDGRAFPFHAEYALGGFAQGKAEQAITAVKVEEVVFLGKPHHAACSLDQVVNLAFVNLAEACDRVLEAEVAQVQSHFAWAVELLEVEAFCGAFCFEVVVGFRGVHIGVGGGHVVRALLQDFGNLLQLAHDACINLLYVENDHAILVGAADDNPVECVGERLVGGRNQFFEQEVVNAVVFFRLKHGFLAVELQVPGFHGHATLACGAVAAGHGACNDALRRTGKAVHVPEFLDGFLLDGKFVLVVEHGERFAVGGVAFAGVVREVSRNSLFKKHKCLFFRL